MCQCHMVAKRYHVPHGGEKIRRGFMFERTDVWQEIVAANKRDVVL